jgi:hypothetical protein
MLTSVKMLATATILGAALAGCGLAETGVASAAAGASQAEQARQAKETEARAQRQVNAAIQQDAEHRQAADADSQ